jgi:4-amino-4-deoxy-L-arabinose transferase-like glycosyltransferase
VARVCLMRTPRRIGEITSALGLGLAAACLLLLAYWAQRPAYRVDLGAGFEWGAASAFGGAESNAEATFRWSGGTSALHLFGLEGRPALLTLRLSATRPAGEPEALLTLRWGERPLGSWQVRRDWRRYRLLVPPEPGPEQTLLLKSTSFEPGGRDSRSLGVALDALRAEGLAARRWHPPPGRWLFLSLLPALLFLALRRAPGPRPLAPLLAGLLALLLAVAFARWPFALAYLLPSLWPTLAVCALALSLPPLRALALRRWPALAGAGSLAAGLLALLAGLLALRWELWAAGLALAAPGVLLLYLGLEPLALFASAATREPGPGAEKAGALVTLVALAAIVALALGLRLFRLDTLPLGIWQDEARHGIGALRVLSDPGYRPIYAPEVDLPGLIFYAIAPAFAAFGVSPWSLRLPMALAGSLLPLAVYLLARPLLGRPWALVGALLVACASWSLSLSRIAWPTIFDPLLLALGLALLWRALHARRRGVALALTLASGLLVGLDGYSYHTGRLAPLFGLWLLLVVAVAGSGQGAGGRRRLGLVAGAWLFALLIALLPLLAYAAGDPQAFTKRVGGVSLLGGSAIASGSPATLLEANALAYTGMLHLRGDANGRHHAPGLPLLDPFSGALMLVGLLVALRRWREPLCWLLVGWLALGALGGVLSLGGVHAMRAVGALVPSLLLAALGLRQLVGQLDAGLQRPWQPLLRRALPLACCLGALVANSWLYFGTMPQDARHVRAFRPVATRIGLEAREWALRPTRPDVYLTEAQLSNDETRLFTLGLANIRAVEDTGGDRMDNTVLLLAATTEPAARDSVLTRLLLRDAAVIPGEQFPDTGEPMFYIYLEPRD